MVSALGKCVLFENLFRLPEQSGGQSVGEGLVAPDLFGTLEDDGGGYGDQVQAQMGDAHQVPDGAVLVECRVFDLARTEPREITLDFGAQAVGFSESFRLSPQPGLSSGVTGEINVGGASVALSFGETGMCSRALGGQLCQFLFVSAPDRTAVLDSGAIHLADDAAVLHGKSGFADGTTAVIELGDRLLVPGVFRDERLGVHFVDYEVVDIVGVVGGIEHYLAAFLLAVGSFDFAHEGLDDLFVGDVVRLGDLDQNDAFPADENMGAIAPEVGELALFAVRRLLDVRVVAEFGLFSTVLALIGLESPMSTLVLT